MFRLTNDERDFVRLRSQIVTINNGRGQHSKYLPYAISEALAELQSQGKRVRRIPEIGFVAIQKRMEDEDEE